MLPVLAALGIPAAIGLIGGIIKNNQENDQNEKERKLDYYKILYGQHLPGDQRQLKGRNVDSVGNIVGGLAGGLQTGASLVNFINQGNLYKSLIDQQSGIGSGLGLGSSVVSAPPSAYTIGSPGQFQLPTSDFSGYFGRG